MIEFVRRFLGPARFQAIVYFNGPRTRWERASRDNSYEEYPGGLRIPLADRSGSLMREPNDEEVICRREFCSEEIARIWVLVKLQGFDHEKIVGEVRPL